MVHLQQPCDLFLQNVTFHTQYLAVYEIWSLLDISTMRHMAIMANMAPVGRARTLVAPMTFTLSLGACELMTMCALAQAIDF